MTNEKNQELIEAIVIVREHARSLREPTALLTAAEIVEAEKRYLEARAILRRAGVRVATDTIGGWP